MCSQEYKYRTSIDVGEGRSIYTRARRRSEHTSNQGGAVGSRVPIGKSECSPLGISCKAWTASFESRLLSSTHANPTQRKVPSALSARILHPTYAPLPPLFEVGAQYPVTHVQLDHTIHSAMKTPSPL